ncbi:MAG: UpxY family transcription antiterminator [Bacteroidetes bacterium]|nr:UpxY family transcription antiterminator [Bacteroidota bacterium]
MDENPWYAVYTKSRYEKKLAENLNQKGIEAYVPLKKVVRQWSDRRKLVSEPLIRSYCFVRPRPGPQQYNEVLDTNGAVRFVWFSGKPAPIPNKQIDILKVITGSDVEVDVLPGSLLKGSTVRVNAGPLAGVTGELVSIAGKHRVLIKIDHLDQVLTISISPLLVEPLPHHPA